MGILSIKGPIKVVVVALYEDDEAVQDFMRIFRNSLKSKDAIIVERSCSTIGQLSSCFQDLSKTCEYSCLMLITHGKDISGKPTYEETADESHPIDKALETWEFVSLILRDAARDRLLFVAACYSGSSEVVDTLMRGWSFALHVVTSEPQRPLEVQKGAEAMALFIDLLVDMRQEEYEEEHLKLAMARVNENYPSIIRLWPWGYENDTSDD